MAETKKNALTSIKNFFLANPELAKAIEKGERVMFYQCDGTGLLFPPDYVEQWGRKYGIGMGRSVISECLETIWTEDPPASESRPEKVMFPVGRGGYSVSGVVLKPDDLEHYEFAICRKDDPTMEKRATLIRQKQLDNKNGRLATVLNLNKSNYIQQSG